MKIYVVYLTEYFGDKLPRWYIGSTFKENVIKNGYNGSHRSKKWRDIYNQEQKDNKHLFKTHIMYECYDRSVAIDIEYKFQVLSNCLSRDDYMNMSYAGGDFGKRNLTTPESIAKGIETKRINGTLKRSAETILKISESNKGRIMTSEERLKMSINGKGKKCLTV